MLGLAVQQFSPNSCPSNKLNKDRQIGANPWSRTGKFNQENNLRSSIKGFVSWVVKWALGPQSVKYLNARVWCCHVIYMDPSHFSISCQAFLWPLLTWPRVWLDQTSLMCRKHFDTVVHLGTKFPPHLNLCNFRRQVDIPFRTRPAMRSLWTKTSEESPFSSPAHLIFANEWIL